MYVILSVKVTGSAEIAVTAGSSMDPHVVIADLLGMTIGDALKEVLSKGYRLVTVTDQYFVCHKPQRKKAPVSKRHLK